MIKTFTFLLTLCTVSIMAQAQDEILSKHASELKKIFKTEKGVLRGYSFSDTKESIKASEDAKLEGEGKDFLVYKVEIDSSEYAEVMYTFDELDKVKMFGVAFIENVNVSVDERMLDDFQAFFTEKHGKFSVNSKNDEVWITADGYIIEMGDSSEGKGDLLEIEIEIYKKK